METITHTETIVNLETYDYELKPLLKLINRALINDDVIKHLNNEEVHRIYHWLDELQSKTLEHGV